MKLQQQIVELYQTKLKSFANQFKLLMMIIFTNDLQIFRIFHKLSHLNETHGCCY